MVKRGGKAHYFGGVVKRRKVQRGRGANFPVFHGRRFQYGGQMPIMQIQHGRGLGGMFRGLLRAVIPHLKKGLAHIGKRALTAGVNVIDDMSENNTSFKNAFKKQGKRELEVLNPINMIRSERIASPRKKRKLNSPRKKRKLNRPPGLI